MADDVFINCPFDAEYSEAFRAIIFAVYACGFRLRSALELEDGSQTRISKIFSLITNCRYVIHDLSRTELDAVNGLPRFNMPLELGLFLSAKHFGDQDQSRKRALIFDTDAYRYQKFISDLSGMDIVGHGGDAVQIACKVRNWLANVSRRRIVSDVIIATAYDKFTAGLPALALGAGFDPLHIPYVDYEIFVTEWLLADEFAH